MKTKNRSYSPPGEAGQGRKERWQRSRWLWLLVMVVMLAGFSQTATAKISFGTYSYISKQPTLANPSIELTLAFYSRWNSDSYFTHGGGGPKIYIDDEYIGSLDKQLSWAYNNGNASGLEDQRGVDGWWYVENDINHAKYKVKCWDPRYDDTKGCFFCTIVIFPKQYKLGVDHQVSIRGYWKTNNENDGVWVQPSWIINAIDDSSLAATSATMTDYNHFNLSGTLNSSYGPSWVLTSADADGSSYIDPGTQSSYGQGTASFSNKSLEIARNDYFSEETKPVEFVVQRSISQKGYTVTGNLYKWFNVQVPGFVRATEISSTSEIWMKNIKLTWLSDDSGSRSKEGKWRVKRRLVGGSSWTTVTSTDLTYNDNPSYTDTDADLSYNTKYEYKIVFIPKNIPGDGECEELSQTLTNVEIVPGFEFSDLTPTPKENSVILSWSHPTPTNGEQLTFKVWRVLNRKSLQTNGTADRKKVIAALTESDLIATVTSSGTTTTSEDTHLANNMTLYLYIVSVDAFGETWFSDVIGPTTLSGHTEVLNVTANRGTYSNVVKVQWDVKHVGVEGTRYVVYRRLLGSEKDEDYLQVHMVTGTEASYYFSDNTAQPGQFYQYRVAAQGKFQDPDTGEIDYQEMSSGKADGFCQSRGTISGRITYGTGTAVADALVMLKKNSEEGDNINQFYSMRVMPQGGIKWMPAEKAGRALFEGKPFTFQLYVRPETVTADGSMLIDGGAFAIVLKPTQTEGQNKVYLQVGSEEIETDIVLMNNLFTNLSVSNNGSTGWTVRVVNDAETVTSQSLTAAEAITWIGNTYFTQAEIDAAVEGHAAYGKKTTDVKIPAVSFGGDRSFTTDHSFIGCLDDIRLWSKELTDDDVLGNFDRLLTGTESGLKLYWPMDEGLNGLPYAYDYSKTSGVANENHGRRESNTEFSTDIPSEDQLRLYGKTDAEGNYVIRGIPFTGEGTSYQVRPTFGVHEFSPKHQTRFINMEALTHNGVDFQDVSSFDVDGVVYYDGTTIPVKDVAIYVDGMLASKDGEAIKTNAQGKFVVSVPIGDHFIQVKKNGHTFVKGGRYPDDPDGVGTRFTFEGNVNNLGFYDNTRVTVAGRVAGGDIENEKLLGLGLSKANIGQARLTLEYANSDMSMINAKKTVNGAAVSYSESDEQRDFDATTPRVNSSAYVAAGDNFVTIETDPVTGEWAAELLPLRYTVQSVVIPSAQADYTFSNLPDIDATDALALRSDSLNEDSVFKYVASAKIEYKSPSVIELTERADGSFGEPTIKVKGLDDNEADVPMYVQDDEGNAVLDANGNVQYNYSKTEDTPNGCPVYQEMSWYTYKLHAFERYINKDAGTDEKKWVTDEVPLSGKTVTIDNQYATGVGVNVENGQVVEPNVKEFELDDDGRLEYNFQAGIPNFQEPYQRGLTITLDDNGTMVPWSGNGAFRAVVLGAASTGNNFTTQAPDKVLMVLRDPPGSNSSATWSQGHTFTEEGTLNVTLETDQSMKQTVATAVNMKIASGIGVATITEVTAAREYAAGFAFKSSVGTNNSWVHSTTTTTDISTSDDPDWVGAPADRFIGLSRNIIFGTCHNVKMKKNEVSGAYELTMEDGYSTGESFDTYFIYSQYNIEKVVIPNFLDLRNGLLETVQNLSAVAQPGAGEAPKYVTLLQPDDPKFGTSNNDKAVWGNKAVNASQAFDNDYTYRGPSYWIILPKDWKSRDDMKVYQDMVNFYNQQIAGWKQQLAKNEKAKVDAIQARSDYLIKNYTIDGSGSMTHQVVDTDVDSHSFVFTEQLEVLLSDQTKMDVDGCGLTVNVEVNTSEKAETSYVNTDEFTNGFSFTLAENGDDDYLTIDAFNAPDKYSPIFVTQGGATSCPYEDKVVTKYYQPGKVIGAQTVQIEKPEIEARVTSLTGIPAGGTGTFQVYIRNNSNTSEDGMYNINVVPASNPDGLVVKMDGLNITTGRAIMVKAGEPMTKTFTVEQSNPDVLTYKDIKIRISSQCQKDNTGIYPEIADTTTVSFYFQPSCSDIHLASSHSLVNTDTKTMQTLSISGYNYPMASLTGVRLEYKGENDADFHTLQEYTKDEDRLAADPTLLELPALKGTEKLEYVIDLRGDDFSDKTYVFRAVTICMQGGVEVNNESEEVRIIRDVTRPQLMATPSPASGILTSADDLVITFNEDIQGGILSKPDNFDVMGELNEGEVAHDVAMALTGTSTAKTEAPLNLNGKSFSVGLWLYLSSSKGTLFTHGTGDNNFTVAVESSKLSVTVGGQKITSTNKLVKDKWLYLNISYQAGDASSSTPTVSAAYAQDASVVTLLNNAATSAYDGNGIITLGGNSLNARVQELTVWNSARSMTDAQADMYTTKSQFTKGLLGYWQLNEGHGSTATDKARNRHITLPSQNAWWINGANFALTLDGTKAATANIGSLNTTNSEDYLIEAWFKANTSQSGAVSVLGTQAMDLRLNTSGKMEFEALGQTTTVNDKNFRDGQWHHVAVSVLKSTNGNGSIYIDGQLSKQIAASGMPLLYGSKLMLGSHQVEGTTHYDQMLKGAIDEVRIWKGRRTADVISNNRYARVKADAAGLVAYYPMEQNEVDLTTNQITATGTFDDAVTGSNEGIPTLSMAFYNSTGQTVTPETSILSSSSTAALKQAPKMENVQFDFVASERQIKVNLSDAYAQRIEGCTIYLTAKGVKDLNGNKAEPITWNVYVQRNNLKWEEPDIAVTKTVDEKATFTATIENRGSESEAWSLSGLPSWLTVNTDGGVLKPLANTTLTFSVAQNVAIGKYEQTIYLTGNSNIAEPLTLNLKVKSEEPLWAVNTSDYSYNMSIVGRLQFQGQLSTDEDDMVAAFNESGECVGVARPQYEPAFDGYFTMMTAYGNADGELLTFKAFDASTGKVYPVVENDDVFFENDAKLGKLSAPFVWNASDKIEQELALKEGWNWMSLYVTPDDMSTASVLSGALGFLNIVNGQGGTYEYDTTLGWNGTLETLSNASTYKLRATAAGQTTLIGSPADVANTPVSVKKGGLTWIGYPVSFTLSPADAFAALSPEDDDMVKSQSAFAVYSEANHMWVGTLKAMEPGKGYMYSSNATVDKTFTYPTTAPASSAALSRTYAEPQSLHFTPVAAESYPGNMVVMAKVMKSGLPMAGVEVAAFADNECRAAISSDADGYLFLLVPGDKSIPMELRAWINGEEVLLGEQLGYQTDRKLGSLSKPVTLDITAAVTGVKSVATESQHTGQLYDLQGRKVSVKESVPVRTGVYVRNGEKVVIRNKK